jgi:hypothetical protein
MEARRKYASEGGKETGGDGDPKRPSAWSY